MSSEVSRGKRRIGTGGQVMSHGRFALFSMALAALGTSSATAGPVVGGYALGYADADFATAPPGTSDGVYSADGALISATADQGPGARTAAKSQSEAWRNRIDINSAATDPRSIVVGSALSFFAVNQKLTGAPGAGATISYTFGFDGAFAPGDNQRYPPQQFAPLQNLTVFFLAYRGTALSNTVVTDSLGTYINFETTNGRTTIGRGVGGVDENEAFRFAGAAACFGDDTRCSEGGVFDESRTLSFDIAVEKDFFILGYLASNTNGNTDFFNTAKLQSIALAPEFGLISDDGGALQRNSDGSFVLAVPEPATWMTCILGFGMIGTALRRKNGRKALQPS